LLLAGAEPSSLPRRADTAERIRFTSALLPIQYLRGMSTGDFQEALAALLGKDAPTCRRR